MNQAVSTAQPSFIAPRLLANPHVQTIVSSVGRRWLLPRREAGFIAQERKDIIDIDGIKLAVYLNTRPDRPLVMIIPGWLGCHGSSYVLSGAAALWRAGFSVARINLRDHGFTADLNEGLFNSALLDEVIGLVDDLTTYYGQGTSGLIGHSLGGNFALRLAKARPNLKVLAVCPAIDPSATIYRIDQSPIYQRYFINKWRSIWREKQAAFPHRYNFSEPLSLSSVSATTDYFVHHHTEFQSTQHYFDAYDLRGDTLKDVKATVITADDDPIIPREQYQGLPDSLRLIHTPQGGHGAYIENWALESWIDRFAVDHFASLRALSATKSRRSHGRN